MTKRTRLTMLQKVLICNGGMAHSVLRGPSAKRGYGVTAPKRRGGREAKK